MSVDFEHRYDVWRVAEDAVRVFDKEARVAMFVAPRDVPDLISTLAAAALPDSWIPDVPPDTAPFDDLYPDEPSFDE